ncbi:MAG: hypothetical protein BAA04_04195 [Firmicutes bacterium ZCTH02-B6]|nr:MAG: hypothetical protein BAA04_04195 [Firmicutes bacterium ZCTH02-B6]
MPSSERTTDGLPGTSPDPAGQTDSRTDRVTYLPPDPKPSRQLRRTGVKIGRKVLEYERPLLALGPLRIVRKADGRLGVRWVRRRG